MRRSSLEHGLCAAALVAAVGSSVGCTLFAGAPWGEADVSLSARFAPPDGRLTDDERLRTSRDYALDDLALTVTFDAVSLSIEDEGGTSSFDPAEPPPGYSLCHGGHCHADDGRLVDYAEVERSLSGAAGGAGLSLPLEDGAIRLAREPTALSPTVCAGGDDDDACLLERGTLRSLSVAMSALELSALVTDLRSGEDARLPPEGVPVVARLSGSALARAALDVPLDGSDEPRVRLTAVLSVSPALFDDVDFALLPRDDDGGLVLDDEAEAALLRSLSESEIAVDVERLPYPRDLTPVLAPTSEEEPETT